MLRCPIGYPAPEGRRIHVIPRKFRERLIELCERRRQINLHPDKLPNFSNYYLATRVVEREWMEIERKLLLAAKQPKAIVDFHNRWKYSCVTLESLREEMLAARGRSGGRL